MINKKSRNKQISNTYKKKKALKDRLSYKSKLILTTMGDILYRKNIEYGNFVLKNIEQKLTKQKRLKIVEQPT
jgi:hypothetical protein